MCKYRVMSIQAQGWSVSRAEVRGQWLKHPSVTQSGHTHIDTNIL